MKSTKILVGLVIGLILINCVLLGLCWFNAYPLKRRPMPVGPAFDYLSKELKLTPAQKAEYEQMRDVHIHFTDSLNTATRMTRDSFFDQLKTPAIKPEVINALEHKISTNITKLDTSTFYHFSRFRAILNAGQQQRFDQIIQDVLHSMGGPQPVGPPGKGTMPPTRRLQNEQPGGGPHDKHRHMQGPPMGGPDHHGPPDRMRPPPGEGPPPGDRRMPPPGGGPPPPGEGPPPGGPPEK